MVIIKWSVIVLLGAAAVSLLAFGPRANREIPPDRIVVDYWEKWTGNEAEQMRLIVNEFNNTVGAEKGIFVRYVSLAAVEQKTMVAIAGGVPPDIAGLYDQNLVQFASIDALQPLEGYAKKYGIDRSYYKPNFWDACNYNGHLYCLISTPMCVALHYDKKAFREGGLDPERPPGTIDELDAFAKQLTVYGPDGRLKRAGFLPMEPNWFINFICYWFGADYWDAHNYKFTLTDPGVVQAYDWVASYSKRLGKSAMTSFQSGFGNFDSPQNAFLDGHVAMEQQGPWMANFIYKLRPGMSEVKWPKDVEMKMPLSQRRENYQWAAAAFPSIRPDLKDVTYIGFDALTIPRGARHPDEAFVFIAWLNRQENIEHLNSLHCKPSPLAKVSEGFIAHHPNPYIDVFERLCASPSAKPCPQIPLMQEVLAELTNLSQQVSLLEVDPKQALGDLQVRLQAKYDQWVHEQRARGLNVQ